MLRVTTERRKLNVDNVINDIVHQARQGRLEAAGTGNQMTRTRVIEIHEVPNGLVNKI